MGNVARPIHSNPDLFSALAHVRTVVEDHMIRADRVGISWREEDYLRAALG